MTAAAYRTEHRRFAGLCLLLLLQGGAAGEAAVEQKTPLNQMDPMVTKAFV